MNKNSLVSVLLKYLHSSANEGLGCRCLNARFFNCHYQSRQSSPFTSSHKINELHFSPLTMTVTASVKVLTVSFSVSIIIYP